MKKLVENLLPIATALFLTSFAAGCGDSDSEPSTPANGQANVTVSPESLNPDFNSQTLDLTVTADADWSIRTDASWVTLKPSGGVKNKPTTIKVAVETNKEFDSRSTSINIVSGNKTVKTINLTQGYAMSAHPSVTSLMMSGEENSSIFTITSNGDWMITSDSNWLKASPDHGTKGETEVTVSVTANEGDDTRNGILNLICGDSDSKISVSQLNYEVEAPEGYSLVWCDEFNVDGKPGSDWVIENQSAGWVNNELQTYTSREVDGKLTLEVKDGYLHVNCFKGSDGKIYSGRMNAKPGTGWTYGYIEASINLPSGKGTWPAFWMMPSNVDWSSNPWPFCGEIDIMEEVGVDANRVSSSLHTGNYNHTKGTQKTHEMYLAGAEGEFHTYAVEWTEDAITTYVDGNVQLKATKAEMGNDHASWPFHYAFYPIVNLAWGGDWGGYAGVNEAALPVTMLVDYVRVFQKR